MLMVSTPPIFCDRVRSSETGVCSIDEGGGLFWNRDLGC